MKTICFLVLFVTKSCNSNSFFPRCKHFGQNHFAWCFVLATNIKPNNIPATSGLTCRRSTNWANKPYIGGLPILSISFNHTLPFSHGSRPSYDTTWEEAVRGFFFYKYRVINHKGNWLGTFLDTFWVNKEKFTRAERDLNLRPFGLTCWRSTKWAN